MYSKLLKKASSAVMAAAMALNGASLWVSNVSAADETKYEFETATITGDITVEKDANASSGAYLKMTDSGNIKLDFEVAKAGTYDITMYVSGIGGDKQQTLSINGVSQGNIGIPQADTFTAVNIPAIKLNEGKNTLEIAKSWGWSNFDYMTVTETVLPEISASQDTPCDPSATAETRALMSYLSSVYGKNIISGQQEIYKYGPHDFEYEFEYLEKLTGHMPALRGFDYGNFCCPAFGSDDGSTERILSWVKNKNGIAEATFHLNVPTDMSSYNGGALDFSKTTYSEKTDFSPAKAIQEGTPEYEYYMKALTTLAGELKKLQEQNVTLIWRPLHEAEGGGGETGSWFWWGREGSAVYKDLWRFTYKTLTEDFGIHNLIWEWNSYNFDSSADWYPGDEYVDLIGYDKYNCTKYLAENNWQASYEHDDSAIASTFYGIMQKYDSKKMVAMAENDCFSTVANLTGDKAGWLYFMTWYDGGSDNINFLTNPTFNTEADTIEMYQSDYCITLDELPADLYSKDVPVPETTTADPSQTTTTAPTTTTTTVTTEADPSKEYAKIVSDKNGTNIVLPKAVSDFYIVVELPEGVTYANGGLGVNVEIDGTSYWANVKWEAKTSGDVAINVEKNFLNCSIGADVVEDEAVIEAVRAKLSEQKTYQAQIWYASDASGKSTSTSNVKILDAYIKSDSSSETTTAVSGEVKATLTGDANLDGKVTLADCVAILQYIANSEKYPLSKEALANADAYNTGDGISGKDALAIQKYDSKSISELPLIEK